jgi:CBS domain-containing protein
VQPLFADADGDAKHVGLFTGCDAVCQVIAAGKDPTTTILDEVMTINTVTITPTHIAIKAQRLMQGARCTSTGICAKDVTRRYGIGVSETNVLADIVATLDREKIKHLRDGERIGVVSRADLVRTWVGSGATRTGDPCTVEFA